MILVKLQVEGIHCWEWCNLEEVSFLKNPHRHIFYIECKKEVNHNDREIEIILFKRKILEYLYSKYPTDDRCINFNTMSCEMIAEDLLKEFDLFSVSVLEDNENWSFIINEK